MKKKSVIKKSAFAGFLLVFIFPFGLTAQNPIVQTNYSADLVPILYNDTVILYTSQDEDDTSGLKMQNGLLNFFNNRGNWTEQGVVTSLKNFKWAFQNNGARAAQCITCNGKFHHYCPMPDRVGIEVLVADCSCVPFKKPLESLWLKTEIKLGLSNKCIII